MNTQPKYAGFWTRFTAYTLDSLILGIPFVLVIMPIIYSFAFDADSLRKLLNSNDMHDFFTLYSTMIKAALMLLFSWAALLAAVTCTKWQATPGKRIMNIYVTDEDGDKPKFWQCFMRYLALPLLLLTIQTPERYYIYENLQHLAGIEKPTQADFQQSLVTPISGLVSIASFVLVCAWYGLVAFRPQKTAGHDILFNTRVIYGRPQKI